MNRPYCREVISIYDFPPGFKNAKYKFLPKMTHFRSIVCLSALLRHKIGVREDVVNKIKSIGSQDG